MIRNALDLAERIASSKLACSPAGEFSKVTRRCTTLALPGSDSAETTVHSACVVAAVARKKNAHLKRIVT